MGDFHGGGGFSWWQKRGEREKNKYAYSLMHYFPLLAGGGVQRLQKKGLTKKTTWALPCLLYVSCTNDDISAPL